MFLWLSLILYCLACFLFVQWFYGNENPFYYMQWNVILSIQSLGLIALIFPLGFLRLRSKYTHREIEDIVIYDRD